MAPNKFDEQIKQKLEARNITPSKQAWSDLEGRLDDRKNNKYKTFWQLGVAASIAVILFTSIWILDTPNENSVVPFVVDSEDTQQDSKLDLIETQNKNSIDQNNYTNNNNPIEEEGSDQTKTINNNQKETSTYIVNTNLVKQSSETTSLETKSEVQDLHFESANALTQQDFKIIEVIAEIKEFEQHNAFVSESEIDSLLKQAEKEILKQRIFRENTRIVDANALLKDVEEEIDQTFRAKVFEALKTSIEKVKTAVAERNQ